MLFRSGDIDRHREPDNVALEVQQMRCTQLEGGVPEDVNMLVYVCVPPYKPHSLFPVCVFQNDIEARPR